MRRGDVGDVGDVGGEDEERGNRDLHENPRQVSPRSPHPSLLREPRRLSSFAVCAPGSTTSHHNGLRHTCGFDSPRLRPAPGVQATQLARVFTEVGNVILVIGTG